MFYCRQGRIPIPVFGQVYRHNDQKLPESIDRHYRKSNQSCLFFLRRKH
jgi:hypothetical protein